jgi:hypothetical protein
MNASRIGVTVTPSCMATQSRAATDLSNLPRGADGRPRTHGRPIGLAPQVTLSTPRMIEACGSQTNL